MTEIPRKWLTLGLRRKSPLDVFRNEIYSQDRYLQAIHKMKYTRILILFLIIATSCKSQTNGIGDRTVEYYLEQVGKLQIEEMIKQNILVDSITIAPKYMDTISNSGLNDDGFHKAFEIMFDVYKEHYNGLLYLQKVEYNNDFYILYFLPNGGGDMQWDILKMKKESWNGKEILTQEEYDSNKSIEFILSNYDEGPKNLENIRIFIKNDFLIMERGNLYHSLYDLKNKKVIINEVSPWHKANDTSKEGLNKWIKENLHDKIAEIINEKQNASR